MKRILGIVFVLTLSFAMAMPSLAAGTKVPSQGDQKGVIAALIERALELGRDPSVFVDVQESAVHTDEVAGPTNFQEYIVYVVLNHEPADVPEDDARLAVLEAVREFITQNTPNEKRAELFAYQYCEERGIDDVLAFEDNELFFDLVRELALLYEIIAP